MSKTSALIPLIGGVSLGIVATITYLLLMRPNIDLSPLGGSSTSLSLTQCQRLMSFPEETNQAPPSVFDNTSHKKPLNMADNQCVAEYADNLSQPEMARQIRQLDNSRSILPNDLSRLNHWTSLTSFTKSLDEMVLSDNSRNHLMAKALVFYSYDYISALEALFSAQQSASNEERLEMFQAEIDVLLDYVRRQYFSENHLIPIETFTAVMNLANEKQPNNVEVLVALVRHHMLVGEYGLAENYIERVPPDVDNLITIDELNRRLTRTMAANLDSDKGIPLKQLGNHFLVEVNFNQEHSLSLMLDTGASRTVLSPRAMRVLTSMSEGVTDLKISGHAETANGFAFTRLYQMEQISVSDFHIDNALVLVMKMSGNDQFDGLLGMDFLSRFEFQIDYQQNRLHLSY